MTLETAFLPVIAAGLVAVFVAGIGVWLNRKIGINPLQDRLISTLKDTIAAQTEQNALLTRENGVLRTRIAYLEQRNLDLETQLETVKTHRRGRIERDRVLNVQDRLESDEEGNGA